MQRRRGDRQIRLGLPKGSAEGSTLPASCASLGTKGCCFRQGSLEGSPNCSSLRVSQFNTIFWSQCFRKDSLEGSHNCSSLHMYHSLLRLSGAKGCCFRKVFRGLPPNVIYICRPFSYSTQCCVNSEHLSSFTPPIYVALGVFFGLIGFLFLFASTSSVFFSSYFNQSYIS